MPRREERTDSGLHVVRDEETKPKKTKEPQQITMCRGRRTLVSGIVAITEVNTGGPKHKLSPEDRKQRREDNKAMKKSREIHRGRRKHGRP